MAYTTEIQQRLLFDRISLPAQLPSQSGIKKCIREDCKMTKKKFLQYPRNFSHKQIPNAQILFLIKLLIVTIGKYTFLTRAVLS